MDSPDLTDSGEESDNLLPKGAENGSRLSVSRERFLVIILLTVQFGALCTDTFIFPFFPQEAKIKGLTDTQIGLVFSSFELSRFSTSLLAGYLVGKLQPRNLCIAGGAVTTVCCISFGLITFIPDKYYLPSCMVIRLIAGCGSATLTVAVMSILIKATSFQSSTIIGLVEMVQGAGYACGPAVGAGLYELGGYMCMFWTIGGVMALVNILQIFLVPELVVEPTSKQSVLTLLRIPGIIVMFLHSFVCKLAGSSRSSGMAQFIAISFNQRSSIIGILFGFWSVIYIVTCPVMTKVVNKGYIFSVMVCGWCLSIVICMFTGPSPLLEFIFHGKKSFILFSVLACISSMQRSAVYLPPFQAALNIAVVNGHQRDSIQTCGMIAGTINSALGLGAMIGPTMGGAITQKLDFTWTLTILAGIETVMLVVMVTYLLVMKITNQPLRPIEENNKPNCVDSESEN